MSGNDDGPVRVLLIGLGKLGLTVLGGLLDRRDVRIVGAVDRDPARVGADVGELVGKPPAGVLVTDDLNADAAGADVAVVMTGSRMAGAAETIALLLRHGVNVVTSAEEVAYPWREFPRESQHLDELAREHGVSVLGAGANPGFLMDVLPLVLSLATQDVRRLRITRTMDLRPHRPERLSRFALGETEEDFAQIPRSVAHGHIGFRQSIDAVADTLGVPVRRIEHRALTPAVITETERIGEFFSIKPGRIAVVSQGAAGFEGENDEEVVSLEEYFGFVDDTDAIPHGDAYLLQGVDQGFTATVRPGVRSFVTTPAVLINMLFPVVRAAPGLRTMTEFAVRDVASKGRRSSGATAATTATTGDVAGRG